MDRSVFAPVLSYDDDGAGDPLVLIHAGIADARMWEPQVDYFADSWRVIRPDLRGFGRTRHTDEDYRHAADAEQLFEYLELPPAVVVGASMGGGVAIDFALSRPDLVRALVLVGSVYGGFRFRDKALFERWRELATVFKTGDLDNAAAIETDIWLGPDTAAGVSQLVCDMVRQSYTHGEIEEATALQPASERLHEIRVPTLVIVGDRDREDIQRAANDLAAGITAAHRATIASAAHLPSLENPHQFNRILEAFLSRLL